MILSQFFQTLGLTVLHMLWIGAVVGGLAFVWLRSNPNADPRTRYACVVGGLMALLLATGFTFAFLTSATPASTIVQTDAIVAATADVSRSSGEVLVRPRNVDTPAIGLDLAPTAMIAWAWIAGIIFMSVRLCRQWTRVRRLRTADVAEPPAAWAEKFDRLKSKIGVHPRISMLVSRAIDAPMVVGWLRPLVLVPATAFTSLTPDQLQTILAHELQHIARRDHLVNMLQAFIEVLLFFHPVTWWLSRQIRVERENCCDDGALLVTGSPRTFAEALLVLESLRTNQTTSPQLLTATGGSLMHRISRLFGSSQPQPLNAGWRAVSACTLLAVAGLTFATATTGTTASAQDRVAAETKQVDLDELKAKIEDRVRAMGIDLRKKVAAGEMSEEDARAKFAEGEKRMWMRYRAAEEKNAFAMKGDAKTPQIDLDELKAEIEERLRAMGTELRKQVAAGEISEKEARAKFAENEKRMWMRYKAAEDKNALAMEADAKNSRIDLDELKAKIEERVRAMGVDLRKKVAAGEMSEADARAKFADGEKRMWMRYRAAEEKNAFAREGDAETTRIDLDELKAEIEERLRAMGADLRKQVAAGEISEEDARAKFAENEKRMWMRYRAAEEKNAFPMKGDAKTPQIDLDELKAEIEERLRAMGADLRKQVAAGEISEKEARAKFAENEKRMWMRYKAAEDKNALAMEADAKNSRIDLDELKAKIEERVRAMGIDLRKKVAAGEMSEADARAKFAEGEKRMWMRYRAAEEKNASGTSMSDYDAAVKKMTEMVKNGEMTREQMKQRLDRMKRADSKDEKAGDRRRSRTDYDAAVRKMTEMVKNGEITREQMQQRLDRMKRAGE